MRKPMLVVVWIIATAATTAIAYFAVNAAGAEVTDRPLTTVIAAGATTSSPTSTTLGSSTSTTGQLTTSTDNTAATTPTSSTPTSNGGTTSTTTTTASSSTSSPEEPWQQVSVPSSGGLVVVSYRSGQVRLESVAPSAGFTYEIDDSGPDRVRVRFESGDAKVEVEVRWEGGLVTDVDEDA